ncbi:hypothetical protein MKUB_09350 [Mycobacterium kubicae]|uniref:Major facilitator superfamily (MFS) profile domain-containing protein n=1 Tax=Mycobacterium kubicae TaxID=120959 RepID=A0AAX1JE50_9MYCO|nr:hypothetical protein [Mycobacterium kubicae]MCV7095051.1 hypothetical protein [Mycobacterium kubicae]ORV97069.1 hypothetical protein AWC13_17505 [Mycobacterium kubicae]QNI10506.1 hypothetical protein GAN18_04155 [Mycobacterium kubicae]QPI38714.1 hypothetical protein I2456_04075 [Mycobacterium kubicae]GFG63445.1 hypothetical protein MKUB_09350 [Mycobacterium kubicae]
MIRTETAVGAIGGVATGYVLWLIAISIGDDVTTVGRWSIAILLASVALAIGAVVGGLLMRWRRKYSWSAFVFGLPVLPVVLTLAVLAEITF